MLYDAMCDHVIKPDNLVTYLEAPTCGRTRLPSDDRSPPALGGTNGRHSKNLFVYEEIITPCGPQAA